MKEDQLALNTMSFHCGLLLASISNFKYYAAANQVPAEFSEKVRSLEDALMSVYNYFCEEMG